MKNTFRTLSAFLTLVRVGCFFILISLSAEAAAGQSFEEWIDKVNTTTKSMNDVEMSINIKAFSLEDHSILYETEFYTIKQATASYYKMQDTEMLHDGYHHLIINHPTKTVNLIREDDKYLAPAPEIMSLDSILSYYSDPVVISEDDKVIRFEVKQSNALVPLIELTIDKQKKQLKRIAYNYKMGSQAGAGNRVEMNFTTKKLTPANKGLLDINRYIIKSTDTIQLTARYKGYQLYTLD